jgi:hypothetical protein
MNGWNTVKDEINGHIEELAAQYDANITEDGFGITWSKMVKNRKESISITATSSFGPHNGKIWGTHTIDKTGALNGGFNDYLTHLEPDASAEYIMAEFNEWVGAFADFINTYKSEVDHAEYVLGV